MQNFCFRCEKQQFAPTTTAVWASNGTGAGTTQLRAARLLVALPTAAARTGDRGTKIMDANPAYAHTRTERELFLALVSSFHSLTNQPVVRQSTTIASDSTNQESAHQNPMRGRKFCSNQMPPFVRQHAIIRGSASEQPFDYSIQKSSSKDTATTQRTTTSKMDSIKRLLRQTSSKLLAGLGAQGHSSRFVLNHHGAHTGIIAPVVTSTNEIQQKLAIKSRRKSSLRGLRPKRQQKKSSREAALLLAAKNYLPPVQFHHVHGKMAKLSKNHFVARRTQSFCQALVFSNRIILPNERVYIKVLELAKGWSGTIRFGFTSVDPATLRFKMPKHVCPDMTNAGHTWARALADDVVRKNSVIHFSYDKNGFIHYGINNQDCGIFCADVNTSQHLWFVVDIYGLTAAVELIDPRAHYTAIGEMDESVLVRNNSSMNASVDEHDGRFDSTGIMHVGADSRASIRASLRKRLAAAIAWETSTRRRPQGQFLTNLKSPTRDFAGDRNHDYFLNVHSALIPITQQNIYSPMPSSLMAVDRPAPRIQSMNEPHDYYQINPSQSQSHYATSDYVQGRAANRAAMTNISATVPLVNSSDPHSIMPPSAAGTSSASISVNSHSRNRVTNDELEICQQLAAVQLNQSDVYGQHHQKHSVTKSPKSTTTNTSCSNNGALPVAAARRRLQPNSSQATNSKRPLDEMKMTYANPNSHSKGKTVHIPQTNVKSNKTKTQRSTSRDRNTNSPVTKDCPICFERPINCVLYQCGHMCTCYECGVKQWRTQSRTCPICRTIIKDVIKTYMS